jgi:hypothetical protein
VEGVNELSLRRLDVGSIDSSLLDDEVAFESSLMVFFDSLITWDLRDEFDSDE